MLSSTAAAILAGGKARRFGGRDKSRLIIAGRSIIVRQVEVLQRVADEVFVVGPSGERFADLGLPVHADRRAECGVLGGIFTALDVTAADAVLVVGCDLPFLSEDLLRELVVRAAGRDGAWVQTSRGIEPVLACYRRGARQAVLGEIEAGRFRASDLQRVLDMAVVDAEELARFGPVEELLANVNTPDDFERIQYGR